MRTPLRLAASAAILASFWSTTAGAENRTTIHVSTVLASNNGRTFDSRLASLRTELKQLRFRSYSLVRSETRVLRGNGGQTGMDLPNGRYLLITTREHAPDHLRLHILLNEDNRPVLNTYVKLELGSVVLLGGPRDQNGTLVITIGARPFKGEEESDDSRDKRDRKTEKRTGPRAGSAPGSASELPSAPPAPAVSAVLPARPAPPGN